MLANPNDKTQLECINDVNKTLKELAATVTKYSNFEKINNSR